MTSSAGPTRRDFSQLERGHEEQRSAEKPQSRVVLSAAGAARLRQTIGVRADADAATILAAIDEALSEHADAPEGADRSAAPDGYTYVTHAELRKLQAAVEDDERAIRDHTIQAAIDDGRLAESSRDTWLSRWDHDPDGVAQLVASLPPLLNFATPTPPPSDQSAAEDALFREAFSQLFPGIAL